MADLISVPDRGAVSGSSTATFGDGLGQIFAMPASGRVDTSIAESDSGVDIGSQSQRVVRRRDQGMELWSDHDHRLAFLPAMVFLHLLRRDLHLRESLFLDLHQAVFQREV